MEKSLFLVCVGFLCLLRLEMVLSLYSRNCNTVSLIEKKQEVGIRGGKLSDDHLFASSYSDDNHSPARGRLDQEASGNQASSWCSKTKDSNQWIAVSLLETWELTAIATQGQYDPMGKAPNVTVHQSWVTQYLVEYSHDNETFYAIEYKAEKPLVFQGNTDGNSTVCNEFPYSVKAKYIRVRPVQWKDTICLRIGLFGTARANFTTFGFFTPGDKADYYIMWWWIFFWTIVGVLLLILFTLLLFYCCYTRHRTYAHEKVLKEKPPKPPIQRRTDDGYVNEAYDMTVITNKTSVPATPSSLEETGDEIQEVTAEFTADEQENQKGIVGFSVTDDMKEDGSSDDEVPNGHVNWEQYKKKALQRPKHTYENVNEIKEPPRD